MRLALSACGATRNLSAVAAAAWGFAKAAVGWGWAAIAWNHEQARVACQLSALKASIVSYPNPQLIIILFSCYTITLIIMH